MRCSSADVGDVLISIIFTETGETVKLFMFFPLVSKIEISVKYLL